jgi:hypothetical protein
LNADIQSKSESALQQAFVDPISVVFDTCIDLIDLVYNEASCLQTQFDHDVLAVG